MIKSLVEKLSIAGILKSKSIISAFLHVDRADFVLPEHIKNAYHDNPLSIGFGQTISQPTTVAIMLELLNTQNGEKILDVGSGSGWTTALLADIIGPKGEVFGIEIVPELVKFGQKNLGKYNYPQAKIIQAGNNLGFPEEAPFDRILVSAASNNIPKELIQQLDTEGIMVIPVRHSVYRIRKKPDGKLEKEEFFGFSFVPLIK